MNTRTVRDFPASADVWPIVETWAKESNYSLKTQTGSTRLYQRGQGFLTAPMMLEISQGGGQVHLEAWISVSPFMRLFALFLIPAEMGIESGGLQLVIPRNMARGAVNKLLNQLQQPSIA